MTEVVNLYAAPEPATRGRYRAQYVLSERSSLQLTNCAGYLTYTNTPIPDSTTVSVYKPPPTGYRVTCYDQITYPLRLSDTRDN